MSREAKGAKGEEAPLEIVIRRDGQVAFRTFTDGMLDVAAELAPDDPRVCAALRRREKAQKGGPHGPVADS